MKGRLCTIIIGLIFLIAGCGRNNNPRTLKFSGTLELTEHMLGTKVSGRVLTLGVEEGDQVRAGQLVATLDRYEQAKRDYDRAQSLLNQGGATQQSLEYAALALDDQQIVSPVDGIVLVKVHEIGEAVPAGSPIVVVGDRSQLWVKIFVPEGWINLINIGQPATVSLDGMKQTFPGHVSFVASKAEFTPRNVQTQEERITQAFAVKVVLDQPQENLRPGVAADVVIHNENQK